MSDEAELRRQRVRAAGAGPLDDATRGILLKGLDDDDWRVRREAVEALARLRPATHDPIVERLMEGLTQADRVGLRNAALECFGRLGPAFSPRLLERLVATPGGEQKFLIAALGECGDPSVASVLGERVDHADPNIGAAVLDALARLGGEDAIAILRRRLRAPEILQRAAALDGLARLGASLSWEELAPLLEHGVTRRAALPLVGATGAPDAIAPMVKLVAEGSLHEARMAVRALGVLVEHPEAERMALVDVLAPARDRLRQILADPDEASGPAAATLALIGRDDAALTAVVEAAAGDVLSRAAIRALRAWGAAATRPLLTSANATVGAARALALELAGELAGDDDAPVLRKELRAGLGESDASVVGACLRAMARWAEGTDAARLVDHAVSGSPVAGHAVRGLEELAKRAPEAVEMSLSTIALESASAELARLVARVRGRKALDQLLAGLSSDRAEVRRSCLTALGQLGDPASTDRVAFALADEDESVRIAAVDSLGRLGSSAATDPLLHALASESLAVRSRAIRALARLGVAEAVPRIAPLVAGPAMVAAEAIEALATLGADDLAVHLERALEHEDPDVVQRALRLVEAVPPTERVPQLSQGLRHPSWHVRSTAARLLGELGLDEARAALEAHAGQERDPHVRESIRAAGIEPPEPPRETTEGPEEA